MILKYLDNDKLRTLTEKGETAAMVMLGFRYWSGCDIHENKDEAINLWKQAAELGDYRGWDALGICYFNGDIFAQSYTEAVNCFVKADNKNMLGECYLHGLGVERNVEKTIELWEAACKDHFLYYDTRFYRVGTVDVMYKLACLCSDGIEMVPNYEKAFYWWNELRHNNIFGGHAAVPKAIYKLACCYYEGKGVKKEIDAALKYFKHTIDAFYRYKESAYNIEYDREHYAVDYYSLKIEGGMAIPAEPDFIISARKVLEEYTG